MHWVRNLLCCFLLAGVSPLAGQTPSVKSPGQGEASATIKTSARIVLLDVLVTDQAGKPVHGLKARHFTVLEDGKPQQVRGFEERRPDMASSRRAVSVNLPPNTYTNYVPTAEPGAINILLFDSLNAKGQSLANARQELLLYLSKLPSKTRIALFTLDWELHMVHGFTDDSRKPIEAAKQLSSSTHPMFSNSRGVSQALAEVKEAGVIRTPM